MSLCIAINNPFSKFAVIAGDGRITNNNVVVRDDHKKLTQLTSHISMFCSGAQDYCEELRSIVEGQINERTSIDELALLIQGACLEVQNHFDVEHPTYLSHNPGFAALATVVAYYDTNSNVCGTIEYCHSDGFVPHDSKESTMRVRGLEREKVFEYLGTHINPERIIENVFSTFKYIGGENGNVGGTITLHVLSPYGIDAYEWRDSQ